MPGKRHSYRELLNQVNDAVYTVDLTTGKFTTLNAAGERLTGYKKKDLMTLPFATIIVPDYLPLVQQMIAKKKKDNVPTVYEVEIIRKDGSRVPVEISSRIIKRGGKMEIIGTARDVSERKHIERQKEIFVSLLTHEIKNPLTAMNMHISLLQKKASDGAHEPMIEPMKAIKQQIQSLTHLMNDFLEVNQLALGKFSISKEEFLLDQLIQVLVTSLPKQKHTVTINSKNGVSVFADKNRIGQVLHNLISNAAKYSPDADRIIITVEKQKRQIIVHIKDFGVGIPKEELAHLFKLFYRTKYSQQSNIRGHGLGLYIARQIINSHKGKMWVESEVGKGSTFSFSIPIHPNPSKLK